MQRHDSDNRMRRLLGCSLAINQEKDEPMKKIFVFSITIAIVAVVAWIGWSDVMIKMRGLLLTVKAFQIWQHNDDLGGKSIDGYYARRSDGSVINYTGTGENRVLDIPSEGIRIRYNTRTQLMSTFGRGIPTVSEDYNSDCS